MDTHAASTDAQLCIRRTSVPLALPRHRLVSLRRTLLPKRKARPPLRSTQFARTYVTMHLRRAGTVAFPRRRPLPSGSRYRSPASSAARSPTQHPQPPGLLRLHLPYWFHQRLTICSITPGTCTTWPVLRLAVFKWSGWESNPRPHHCERCALPTELPPRPSPRRGRGAGAEGGIVRRGGWGVPPRGGLDAGGAVPRPDPETANPRAAWA